MANLRWIVWAKAVALIDMVLSGIMLVVVILTVIVTGIIGAFRRISMQGEGILWIFYWIFLVISIFPIIVFQWAAYMLLKATRLDAAPKSSVEKAKAWIYVNIIFFALPSAFLLVNILTINIVILHCVLLVLLVLFRACLLYIVGEFVPELEKASRQSAPLFYSVPSED